MQTAAIQVCETFNQQHGSKGSIRFSLLTENDDVSEVFRLVNLAYKVEIGSRAVAFKKDDRFLEVAEVSEFIGASNQCMIKVGIAVLLFANFTKLLNAVRRPSLPFLEALLGALGLT